jgi:hypothetical protein
LSANLPKNGPVWAIAEDHVNPNLLLRARVWSVLLVDGGRSGFNSKADCRRSRARSEYSETRERSRRRHVRRGIYILDNYTPLRSIKPEMLRQEAAVFPVKDALMYIQSQPLGGAARVFRASASTLLTIRRMARLSRGI